MNTLEIGIIGAGLLILVVFLIARRSCKKDSSVGDGGYWSGSGDGSVDGGHHGHHSDGGGAHGGGDSGGGDGGGGDGGGGH